MPRLVVSALAASVVFAAAAFTTTAATADMKSEPVLKTEFQGMEGTEANVVRIEVGPGAETVRHIHPGHVILYVVEGAIEIDMDGQEPRTVSAGEAIYEPPNRPMIGRNKSSEEGARLIVFQVGTTGEPLTVAQPE